MTVESREQEINIDGILKLLATKHRTPWILESPNRKYLSENEAKLSAEVNQISQSELQVLEEIALLCSYSPFVQDILALRATISATLNIELPTTDHVGARALLRRIYLETRVVYWRGVQAIISKYGLAFSLYWPRNQYFEWNEEIKADYQREKGVTEEEAEAIVAAKLHAEYESGNFPTIIDAILLENNPFSEDVVGHWRQHGYLLEIAEGLNSGYRFGVNVDTPFIEIRVPLYASLPEIRDLVGKLYPQIEKNRAARFAKPARKEARKEKLSHMLIALRMSNKGEHLEAIAERLDEIDGQIGDHKDDFRKAASVERLIGRVKQEMELRFNKNR